MSPPSPPASTPLVPVRPRGHRPAILAAITFIAGLLIGAGVTFAVGRHIIRDRINHPEKIPQHVIARVKRELNLTPEQTGKVSEIINRHFDAIMKLRQENQPRVQEQFDQLDKEVSDVLTDQQKPIWHRHVERLRHMGPPPFGPPGPPPLGPPPPGPPPPPQPRLMPPPPPPPNP